MAIWMSPGVYTREIDLTTTIPAVATNISVLVIREPWKGSEYEQHFVSNEDMLKDLVGTPTSKSFKDIMAGMGFLKYGSMLYTSIVRPEDATFAGAVIKDGYNNTGEEFTTSFTYSVSGSVPDTEDDGPYDYQALGITDLTEFPEAVQNTLSENTEDALWFISTWRNNNANRIRTLVFDRELHRAALYYDVNEETFDTPDDITLSVEAEETLTAMINNDPAAFIAIRDTEISFDSEYQMGVIVQVKHQGDSLWSQEETFLVSSDETERDDSGRPLFIEDVINTQSNYVRVALNPFKKTNSEVDVGPIQIGTEEFVQLSGGKDGVWGRDSGEGYELSQNAAVMKAYNLYSNPEEIDVNLFIEADKGVEVKRELINICEVKRKDSMCVLDVPRDLVINNDGSEANDLTRWRKGQGTSTFNPNTSYAAIYGNWLEVFEKYNKKYRWIPSSGHLAGLYANTDAQQDPWWAPAGLNRTILTGVRRLAWNPDLGERDLLYKNGINPIVSFSGQGKVVWGQKTLLDKSSAFNRVNVRRLFLVLQKAISKASKYFVFEMNDNVTWLQMTNMIEPFLRDVQGRRGIYDFKVQIDEVVNTPERIDRNELWGNIFIQPTRAAEFIILNFIATPTGANFSEYIGE